MSKPTPIQINEWFKDSKIYGMLDEDEKKVLKILSDILERPHNDNIFDVIYDNVDLIKKHLPLMNLYVGIMGYPRQTVSEMIFGAISIHEMKTNPMVDNFIYGRPAPIITPDTNPSFFTVPKIKDEEDLSWIKNPHKKDKDDE